MTRLSAWTGMALGVSGGAYFGLQLRGGPGVLPVAGIALSILVLAGAARSLGGHRGWQLAMCVATLPLLARFLLVYFRTYRAWPGLALIGLATLTFGLGLLGYFLDRYQPSGEGGAPPL